MVDYPVLESRVRVLRLRDMTREELEAELAAYRKFLSALLRDPEAGTAAALGESPALVAAWAGLDAFRSAPIDTPIDPREMSFDEGKVGGVH